ncbi:MAG: hypothetical protein Q8K32_06780 [Archangium sp.]|nr:hypothetical protein [Archangium sp.]
MSQSVNRALAAAFGLLLLGVSLGAALRLGQVTPVDVNVSHATHAHSHTLYWGWAGLALFTLFFERVGATGRSARWVLGALAAQGLATFGVFLHSGYGRPGVVLSALTLVPFFAAVVIFFKAAHRMRGADLAFLRAAAVFVVIAYVCALSRVVLKVLHHDDPVLSALAVHLFLGAFGAFFVMGVMGLTVRALGKPPGRRLGVVLGVGAPLLMWPSVLTVPGLEGSPLAALARFSAVVLLVPAAAWSAWVFHASAGAAHRWLWRSAALAWSVGVLLFALMATGALQALVMNRHAVVFVVHLQTLGVVTSSLLLFIELRAPRPSARALWLHQLGIGLMLSGLGVAASWPGRSGLVLAALGGVSVVVGQAWAAARFLITSKHRAPLLKEAT